MPMQDLPKLEGGRGIAVLVEQVAEGGKAHAAGVRKGFALVEMNGRGEFVQLPGWQVRMLLEPPITLVFDTDPVLPSSPVCTEIRLQLPPKGGLGMATREPLVGPKDFGFLAEEVVFEQSGGEFQAARGGALRTAMAPLLSPGSGAVSRPEGSRSGGKPASASASAAAGVLCACIADDKSGESDDEGFFAGHRFDATGIDAYEYPHAFVTTAPWDAKPAPEPPEPPEQTPEQTPEPVGALAPASSRPPPGDYVSAFVLDAAALGTMEHNDEASFGALSPQRRANSVGAGGFAVEEWLPQQLVDALGFCSCGAAGRSPAQAVGAAARRRSAPPPPVMYGRRQV